MKYKAPVQNQMSASVLYRFHFVLFYTFTVLKKTYEKTNLYHHRNSRLIFLQ